MRLTALLVPVLVLAGCSSTGTGAAAIPSSAAPTTYNDAPACVLFDRLSSIGLSTAEQIQFITDKAGADPTLQRLMFTAQVSGSTADINAVTAWCASHTGGSASP